ncbi:MAG TPA: holo-ACP synthase [Aquabacterium sp.]|nr:holo-ACP synthase [Aquabacterium sp.]
MIVDIGTDLCDIRRLQSTLERQGDRFAQRVLGPQEWLIYQQRLGEAPGRALRYLATRFAAKEAFSKAIGTGMRAPMSWQHCEILNAASGQPALALSGELAPWFETRCWTAHVSVSDEVDHALAFVVIERRLDEPPAA